MKNKAVSRVLYIFIALLFVAGALVIGLYKFDNRSLNLEIVTTEGSQFVHIENTEIFNRTFSEINFNGVDYARVKGVKIYGSVKSMYLKKLTYSEFFGYMKDVPTGGAAIIDDYLQISGTGDIRVIMVPEFCDFLLKYSASFMLERLILLGIWGIITSILLIIVEVYKEKAEDSRDNHGPVYEIRKFLGDIKKYWQYTVYSAETDLKAEVANSYLNRLWWLLEPLFDMLVYVIVFGKIMGSSIQNYAAFVFSALLMWSFFNKTINYSVKLVRNNRDIVTRVYIPKFVLLLSNMMLNLFKLMFSLIVLVILILIFRIHIGFAILWVIPAFSLMVLLAFGAGMIFMHFGVYVDDLAYAVGILLNMLMFLSGIFYEVMTTLPDPLNSLMLCLNPIALFVDTMRNALLYNQVTNVPFICIWLVLSVVLCCVGVHTVYRNENSYVKVV